jgi:peptidoglycan/LPS O-acetylase OafA/YrhL
VAAVWLACNRRARRSVERAALFLVTALVVVAPWTYRNWRVFHAFVPVSTAGGLALFQGNARLTRQEVYDLYDAVQGRIEQYHYAQRMGLEAIRERQPGWLFEKIAEQMPMFWEAESMAVIHVKRGAYGPASPQAARWTALVMLFPYLVALILFIPGIALLAPRRGIFLLVLFLVYYNALHVVTHGFNRYRLPIMPVVFLLASWALAAWRTGEPRLTLRRGLCAAVLGLALAVAVVPSVARQWTHEAFGLTHGDDRGPAEAPPE